MVEVVHHEKSKDEYAYSEVEDFSDAGEVSRSNKDR